MMDFNVGLQDVRIVVIQELWNQLTFQTLDLVSETRQMILGKDCFREFAKSISELSILLQSLNAKKIEAAMGSEAAKTALEALNSQLSKACQIIKDCKVGSRLRLLLHSRSMLQQMENLSKEIAQTMSSLQLVNLDIAVNLKSKADEIISNLRSMEFRSAAAMEAITSEIEKSITQSSNNGENARKLLQRIADTVGASANASLVRNELALLKQEKEEMEAQKKQAEALQLSQLIQLLYSTEIVMSPQDEEIATYHQQCPIEAFICPLCNEMMADPVAIFCGHSFERKAIEEYLRSGERTCPICREELSSTELTANRLLQSSIEEWKRRENDKKFQAAIHAITSSDHALQKRALDDLQVLMKMPYYTKIVAEMGLIPKFIDILKNEKLNNMVALKCLYYLTKFCDNHKKAIIEAGAILYILRKLYKGVATLDAVAILLELSVKENLVQKIGDTRDCIPILVSLLDNENPEVSQIAQKVLQNLSSHTHFVVRMAEAGYFQPFVARFNQGPQETRSSMAAALIQMQLKVNGIRDLKDKQFIQNLVQMLSSSSPACKSASLKSIKKLIEYPEMVEWLLAYPATIPHLLRLISFVWSDPHWKEEAAEILALLVEGSQFSDLQVHQGLQELQSQHNVSLFLQHVAISDFQIKIHLLHLLAVLSSKSEMVQNLIRTDMDAVARLFSSLEGDQPLVRQWAMKLIYCISEGHPDGVPLPPSPAKETAVNRLVAILTCSPDIKERSTAAGIISQLPNDDIIIDDILYKSEALKAIHEVICCTDEEHIGITAPDELGASLLENALAALLRYTEPTKPKLRRQVGKLELYPSLVRVLSTGSSLAKQRTATALAHLSQSTSQSLSNAAIVNNSVPLLHRMKLFSNTSWCCSASLENESLCAVHGTACSPRDTFCLVKSDALKPLVQTLGDTESGAAEAALMALETLLADYNTLSRAAAAIVDSQGVVPILQVLEKGSLPAKSKALDIFQKIQMHAQITNPLFERSGRILIQLLDDDELRKKAALVLRQMHVFPEQSSYY